MAHEYRIYVENVEGDGDDYLVESPHNMYLIDPNSEIVRWFGVEYDAELSEAILKGSEKNIHINSLLHRYTSNPL